MKSPEYVYDTARTWRTLLDENRAATPAEMRRMAEAFSRSGFTDGYFAERINVSMLGVRREADKQSSREVEKFGGLQKRIPVFMDVTLSADAPISLTLSANGRTVTVEGDLPQAAKTAPMTEESVLRSLSRFGGTAFEVKEAHAHVAEGLMLPVSRLNDLRRRAVESLENCFALPPRRELPADEKRPQQIGRKSRSARFYRSEQITREAKAYFERIYLPLHRYTSEANGVVVPPVIFDSRLDEIREALKQAKAAGAVYALVGNLGHLAFVREVGLIPVGDFRLNVTNGETVAALEEMGFEEILMSPELTLPQMRDLGGNTAAVVYGRLPMMLLEKCVIRELANCDACDRGTVRMVDRKGIAFPVLREWEHRNVVYNSLPTSMSDREDQLQRNGLINRHFIFSDESPRRVDEVIRAHQKGEPIGGLVRRM